MDVSQNLAQAIDALQLAGECGGDLDRTTYQKAHEDLVKLRDAIVTYDAQLNAKEDSPSGADYEALIALLGLQLMPCRSKNAEILVASVGEEYRSMLVCGDWIKKHCQPYQAFTSGHRWNGWECPYFAFEVAKKIAQDMPGLQYEPETDEFVMEDHSAPEGEGLERFSSSVINVDGVPTKVYAIGAWSWCWASCEGTIPSDRCSATNEEAERAMHIALVSLVPHVLHYASMRHAASDAHRDAANARSVVAKFEERASA